MTIDYLIVGAGLAGITAAERLIASGADVLVVEERPQIGGNVYDFVDEDGL